MERTIAAAIFAALILSVSTLNGAPSQASTLTAGGNYAGTSHVGEDHSNQMLAGVTISKANFSLANLSGTVLTDAAAEKANFTGALLMGADLSGAQLAKAVFTKGGVKEVSFLPMMIDNLYRPEVLRRGDERFDDMVRYMDWASEGFDHRFEVRGDEVLVTSATAERRAA